MPIEPRSNLGIDSTRKNQFRWLRAVFAEVAAVRRDQSRQMSVIIYFWPIRTKTNCSRANGEDRWPISQANKTLTTTSIEAKENEQPCGRNQFRNLWKLTNQPGNSKSAQSTHTTLKAPVQA